MQSSALPLGHAAIEEDELHAADRISQGIKALLVVSNGHGEDLISLRILESLHQLHPELPLEVLPLVGDGKTFAKAISSGWLRKIGPTATMPSGGFSNQSLKGLWADLLAGLIFLFFRQWSSIRLASQEGRSILAVGDLLPLFMAWGSGSFFGFIGTPKSDYTWRSFANQAFSDYYHRLKGSEWDPWEWMLMSSSRCKMVAVRDTLTARGLKRHGVLANAPGNPMMDGLRKETCPPSLNGYRRILLLCGSRTPEALNNFVRLLNCLEELETNEPIAVLVALGSSPSPNRLTETLINKHYLAISSPFYDLKMHSCWQKNSQSVLLGPGQFFSWAGLAEVGLTTAGTATEQLVGLGIPAISYPGQGPQFKKGFALRQSRMLDGSVRPFFDPMTIADQLKLLLEDSQLRQSLGSRGVNRMGRPGASHRLAELVSRLLLR